MLPINNYNSQCYIHTTLAVPVSRLLRIRRSVNLLVAPRPDGRPAPVEGRYQSPILIQWQRTPRAGRVLDVTLTRLE